MAAKQKRYVVTGAYVTARVDTPTGPTVLGFHLNAVLPPEVPEETIAHLLRVGLIAEAEPDDIDVAGEKADAAAAKEAAKQAETVDA